MDNIPMLTRTAKKVLRGYIDNYEYIQEKNWGMIPGHSLRYYLNEGSPAVQRLSANDFSEAMKELSTANLIKVYDDGSSELKPGGLMYFRASRMTRSRKIFFSIVLPLIVSIIAACATTIITLILFGLLPL